MASHPQETNAWRRCFIGGLTALAVGVAGEAGFSDPALPSSDVSPAAASFVARALDHVTPEFELVRVGTWLGKRVLGQKRPSQCG